MGNNIDKINIIDPYEDINYCGTIENTPEIRTIESRKRKKNNEICLETQYNLRVNPQKNIIFNSEYLELYKKKNSKKGKKRKYKVKYNVKPSPKKKTKSSPKVKNKSSPKKKNKSSNRKKVHNKIIHKRKQISQIDRKKILFDQKYICNFCDKLLDPNHEFDHIIPLCCGGLNKYKNYQALCKECHQYKSDFLDERIIKPMVEKDRKYDPIKICYILKKIYKNHYD